MNFSSKYESLFLFLLLALFLQCTKHKQDASDVNYLITSDISNQNVSSFAQDNDGFMWIGTSRGLNKYDGYDYRQYLQDSTKRSIVGNEINDIFFDSKKRLWVATQNGLSMKGRYGYFKTIKNIDSKYPPLQIKEAINKDILINQRAFISRYDTINQRFSVIFKFENDYILNHFLLDQKNHLWTISKNTIKCFDYNSMKLLRTYPALTKTNYFTSYIVGNEVYVIHGKGGLRIFDSNTLEEKKIPTTIANHPILSKAIITIIHPFRDKLLINTNKNGLFIFDKKTNQILRHNDQGFPFKLKSEDISKLFTDNSNNLWIGTTDQNFQVIFKGQHPFNQDIELNNLTKKNAITALKIDKNDHLWMATNTDRLINYDIKNKTFSSLDLKNFFLENPYFQNKVKAIQIDNQNYVWLKTQGKIIKCQNDHGTLTRKENFFTNELLHGLELDKYGNIWSANQNNMMYLIRNGSKKLDSIKYGDKPIKYNKVAFKALKNGNILVATSHQYIHIINPVDLSISKISLSKYIPDSQFLPSVVFEDSKNNIIIGIDNKGLYKLNLKTKKFEQLGQIPYKEILSIEEDNRGNYWIGTLYGLYKYDVSQKRYFSFYSYDGTGGNQFSSYSVAKSSDNQFYFGGTHGITEFNPDKIQNKSSTKIPIYFEEIQPHKQLPSNKKIILSNKDNDLNINFVALDFSKFSKIRYYYKMEGIDKDWIDARNNRQVSYSNLPAGNYKFKIYITSNNNVDPISENSFDVTVKRSPFFSIVAIIFYSLMVCFLIYYVNRLYVRTKNSKNQAIIAEREKDQEKKLNEMNMSFFANMSHEFRTPLTMISGPIELVSNDPELNDYNKNLLNVANKSVARMLRLVSQIMAFNKLENDALKLNLEYVDVIHELKEIIEIFSLNENIKKIKIYTSGLHNTCFLDLDLDFFERIMNNILSNAFKFTPIEGTININFEIIGLNEASEIFAIDNNTDKNYDHYIKVSVEDSGIGIPEENLKDIFKKYYQIVYNPKSNTGIYNWGTGIGLYFTQRMAEMHDGFIKAENKKTGSGAIFTFILPIHQNIQNPELKKDKKQILDSEENIYNKNLISPDVEIDKTAENNKTILIIDDDFQISAYLNLILQSYYNVVTRYDADSALEDIVEIDPDIIVCDVKMPGTSGYDFATKMKSNLQFSHIPIVLLTAKSTIQEKVEGLKTGANIYITKPFNPEYLIAAINSQLLNIEILRKKITSVTTIAEIGDELSENDKKLLNDLYKIMESELSNAELNISSLCKIMGMSRTKFYHKIKHLTGENPNDFFKQYKLNKAAEFIKLKKYSISQVAEKTGFATLPHFSSSFKKQFGISPSEY